MAASEELSQVISRLSKGEIVRVLLDHSPIFIRFLDDASKIFLTTLIYKGDNFIPLSIREAVASKAPIFSSLSACLTIDEENFQIHLNHVSLNSLPNTEKLKQLLEEFERLAEEWRAYLDERGRKDLLHVRIK